MGGCILCSISERGAAGNGKRGEDPPTPRLRRGRRRAEGRFLSSLRGLFGRSRPVIPSAEALGYCQGAEKNRTFHETR
jgi:hypothetical protein